MASIHPFAPDSELPESAGQLVGRFILGTTAGSALISAAILSILWPPAAWTPRSATVAALVVFAVIAALLTRLSLRPRFPMTAALCGVALMAMLFTGLVSGLLADGIRGPTIGLCAVIVCAVGAVAGTRYAVALGIVAIVEMAVLGWAEVVGAIPRSAATTPLPIVLLFDCLIVAVAVIGGGLISRVLNQYLHSAARREERFRGLLRIAAQWYWEQDRDFRYTHVSEAVVDDAGVTRADRVNHIPWQLADMGLSPEQLDAHRADLEAHLPFSALLARMRDGTTGRWRTVSISGEPKFDGEGKFQGYWGVARDVTQEMHAQRAVASTETRYRELFTRSPSPLFLHRRDVVFDANEAAARLFGFANAAAMNGFSMLNLFPAGVMRERAAQQLAELEAMAVGEGVPVSDYQVRAVDGRPLNVQATAVRVDTTGGLATLSIFLDITARQAVEGALRRSEAMLSHLFATSPDCIALNEMATGRYALVNPAFCRLTGFTAEEVVGRTAAELGLWHDQRQFDRLLALLERDGRVMDLPAVVVAKSGQLVSMLLAAGHFVMDHRDYLVVNARDVTESERTRLQHTAILERASIGIAFIRERRFVQSNPYFEQMFGWGPHELLGHPASAVWTTEEDFREMDQIAGPLLAAGKPFEIERRMRRYDDSLFWCRLMAQAVDPDDPSRGGTIWIAEDVTERRRLDEALASARDAAEAASRAKSAFLANTSHEIRTPLNGLLGLTRLAMQQDLAQERRQQYLEQILDSAQSLAGIMSDILDVSKIEAGKIALEDTPFNLRDALHAIHHAYDSLAQVKGLALRLSIDDALPTTVRGDPVRVRQILSNFITNALKFTERGQVCIEATQGANGTLRLAVADTGLGVPPDTQDRLFTPFSQGDTSTTRRYGGTGLGLSICRELAHLMGGTVGVVSVPGHGSTFWAELPLPRATPVEPQADREDSDLDLLHGARVLMAEDNPVNMMIAVAMLEQWGVGVEQAFDGRSAVAAVHAAAREGRPFDAVIMDVQMPVMGGHEAARELRKHYGATTLPVIALTAAALVSEREEAMRSGMDDFLTKPIDAAKLRGALASLVRRRSDAPA